MTSRPSTAAPILAVLAIVLVTLGAYVGGYFWLARYVRRITIDEEVFIRRQFPSNSVGLAYQPLAKIESWITGLDVKAVEANPYGD